MPIKILSIWRNLPIHLKMTMLIAAFTIVATASIAAYTQVSARDEITAAVHAQNLQRARGTAQVLDTFISEILDDLKFLGTATNAIEFLRDPRLPAPREQIEVDLKRIRAIYEYDVLFLTDVSGIVLVSTNARLVGRNLNTAPYFRSAMASQIALDEPRYDPSDQQVYIYFSAPVRDTSGAIWGAVIGRVTMTALDQIIAVDNNFAGHDEHGILWNDLGIRLVHSKRPDLRFKPYAPLNPDVANVIAYEQRYGPATAELLAAASHSPELVQLGKSLLYNRTTDPYVHYISDSGVPVHAALVPLNNQRWIYAVVTHEPQIQKIVAAQTERVFLTTLIVGVIALLGALVAAHWITHPMRQVAETANALAQGDMSRRLRLNQHDEIGQLAFAFDAMADALDEKENQLRDHAQTLEQRVEARTDELIKSEGKYRALLNDAGDAILLADLQGNWVDANRKAEDLFGYSKAQLVGMGVEQIYPVAELPRALSVFEEIIETGSGILRDGLILRQDGTTVPVEITGSRIEYSDGQIIQSIFRNITAQKQRERELHALATMAHALRAATTRAEMLPIILDQVMYLLDAPGATFTTHDPASGEIVIESARGQWARGIGLRMPPDKSVAGHVIATGEPYATNDAENDPLLVRPAWMGNLTAFAGIPLIAQSEIIGALFVGRGNTIGEDDVRLLTALADMAANALRRAALYEETARLVEQTQKNVRRLSTLRTVDQAISASLDLQLVLRVLLDQVVTFLQADAADILLFNPHSQLLKFAEGRGFTSREIERHNCRWGEGLAGQIALERRAQHIPNLTRVTNHSVRLTALQREGMVAYLGAPLIAKGQLKGVLEIFHRQPLAAPDEWLDFLESLALQAAIAIDNVALFDDLQRSNLELALAADAMIEGWARALELRGYEPAGHSRRVTEMSVRLARTLGLANAELAHMRRGALLHDIGKLNVPESILFKAAPLNEAEMARVRQHPADALELLAPVEFLKPALAIPHCHHEKWDGTGYPRGLKAEEIPLSARIFAIVDVWDTLRSARPYAPAWEDEHARAYLREQTGKQFDPHIVE
ncbi:MAG: GAF domain-containing protein, partial [Anaerolineales bacterium]|nr:GAF domain-containing protein [Anaerolineales bacterium]